jgi:hypothetical protein
MVITQQFRKTECTVRLVPWFCGGFSRHAGLSSDDSFWSSVCSAREEHPALLDIGSMGPPDYPSAWLHPSRARLRFARQDHCSSVTTCRFSTSLARDSARTQTCQTRDCDRLGYVTQKGLHPARFAAYLSRERSPVRTRPARVTSVADTGPALPGGSICLIVIIARSRQEGMYLTRTCYAEACDLSNIIDPEAKQQI